MADVFSAPKVGSPRAIGSRYGNTSGTSTDIIYPVSKLVNGQFQSGRTLEFNWKSDKHRFWLPRSTRLLFCGPYAAVRSTIAYAGELLVAVASS